MRRGAKELTERVTMRHKIPEAVHACHQREHGAPNTHNSHIHKMDRYDSEKYGYVLAEGGLSGSNCDWGFSR